ncbi:MAG: glycosyltransferase family 4 protein [Flavisolibacter sp.]
MQKLIHLNYYYHGEFTQPEQALAKHRLSSGFVPFIKEKFQFVSIKHLDHQGHETIDGVPYHFFKSSNRFWYIPFQTHRLIQREKPDIILVEGFVFPLQVICLRLQLGKKTVIIAQHQGEKPLKGLKGLIQKISARCINGFAFTSVDNALPWLANKVIPQKELCFEILSASTEFRLQNKMKARERLGISGDPVFLWVARLNANKDPLTVLRAFSNYALLHPEARLYMIYQTQDLLPAVKDYLEQAPGLKKFVKLMGEIPHAALEGWFNAADYYLSGSHSEGSGYALVEAMSCGCIPIVTSIPPFRKITREGSLGFLYQAGNPGDLLRQLNALPAAYPRTLSRQVQEHATQGLSSKMIALQLEKVCQHLTR